MALLMTMLPGHPPLPLSLSWWGGTGLLGDLELFLAQWDHCKLGAVLKDTPWGLQLTTAQCVLATATEGGLLVMKHSHSSSCVQIWNRWEHSCIASVN